MRAEIRRLEQQEKRLCLAVTDKGKHEELFQSGPFATGKVGCESAQLIAGPHNPGASSPHNGLNIIIRKSETVASRGVQSDRRPWDKEILVVVGEEDRAFRDIQRVNEKTQQMRGELNAERQARKAAQERGYGSLRIERTVLKDRCEGFFFSSSVRVATVGPS